MPLSRLKPRSAPEAQASALANPPTAGCRRALIVGTDPVSARLCQETLERTGFAVERAGSGVDAVVSARGRVPDLIVMDFQLSDVSAAETIGWLRANQALKSVPIIVLGIADHSRLPAKDMTAMAGLAKPLTSAAIERAVRGLCG
jgi:CheY-like chemotaxis protein